MYRLNFSNRFWKILPSGHAYLIVFLQSVPPNSCFFRTDFGVIWYVEFEYSIRFLELLLKFSRKIDFLQKMGGRHILIFDIGTPSRPSRWLLSGNLYTIRCAITWATLCFLNFSKIFYSKKVFFVPPEGCQIVKMLNFDPHLAPPTFGGGAWSPHFCD